MNLREELRAAIQAAPTGENAELLNRCYVALGERQDKSAPAGYVMVPVEPSEKMLDILYHNSPGLSDHLLVAIWAELLAAASPAPAQPAVVMPDVSAMAKVLSDRAADACNINRDDNWAMYGQEYIDDVQAMLEVARPNKGAGSHE